MRIVEYMVPTLDTIEPITFCTDPHSMAGVFRQTVYMCGESHRLLMQLPVWSEITLKVSIGIIYHDITKQVANPQITIMVVHHTAYFLNAGDVVQIIEAEIDHRQVVLSEIPHVTLLVDKVIFNNRLEDSSSDGGTDKYMFLFIFFQIPYLLWDDFFKRQYID